MQELVEAEGRLFPFFEGGGAGEGREMGVEGGLFVPPA